MPALSLPRSNVSDEPSPTRTVIPASRYHTVKAALRRGKDSHDGCCAPRSGFEPSARQRSVVGRARRQAPQTRQAPPSLGRGGRGGRREADRRDEDAGRDVLERHAGGPDETRARRLSVRVSAVRIVRQIPAYREKNRESRRFSGFFARMRPENIAKSVVCKMSSLPNRTGN